jgi:hypothetical protein
MGKNTKIIVLGFVVIASTFSGCLVYADGDIPLTYENLTPIKEEIVKEAAKFYMDMMLKDYIYEKEILGFNPGWEPSSDSVNDAILIPVYDLNGYLITYYALGYYGEGNMPTFDQFMSDLSSFCEEWMQCPLNSNLFSEKNDLGFNKELRDQQREECAKEQDRWDALFGKFFSSYMNNYLQGYTTRKIPKELWTKVKRFWNGFKKTFPRDRALC